MTSNELREHIRRLNEIERQKHELKKQFALDRIKRLRQQKRTQDERTKVTQ
jgi:hypothetical protein